MSGHFQVFRVNVCLQWVWEGEIFSERFLDGKALLQGFLRITDLAATGLREIALAKKLQHQH
jgi:hypothetical protein